MRGWPVLLCKATPQVGSGHSQTHPTGSLSADSLLLASSWDGIETELPLRVRLESRRPGPVGTLASAPPPACPHIPAAFSAPPGPPELLTFYTRPCGQLWAVKTGLAPWRQIT